MEEYVPENNLVVMFLLIILTLGLYFLWWIPKVSRVFDDNPVTNVILIFLTGGLWFIYLTLIYLQKSDMLNGRDTKWVMILFFPILPLIIQHNINEKYFPGR